MSRRIIRLLIIPATLLGVAGFALALAGLITKSTTVWFVGPAGAVIAFVAVYSNHSGRISPRVGPPWMKLTMRLYKRRFQRKQRFHHSS